jgi:putative transposase
MTGNNPTDRSKLGTKRHILTDRKGIPLSAVISSANTHDIKLVTEDVVDNAVIRRSSSKYRNRRIRIRRRQQHLCLDKGYNSENEEQELIKRGYVLHIPTKKKKKGTNNEKDITRPISNIKKYSPKRWVVERTNS